MEIVTTQSALSAHGLMFHHFHGTPPYIPSQGSITGEEFDRMLTLYKKKWNLVPAKEWFDRAVSDTLGEKDVCISFDDNLLCQFKIALPVLQKHRLTAFWFIYTAPLQGKEEKLELYRYFRYKCFETLDDFYGAFDLEIARSSVHKKVLVGIAEYENHPFVAFLRGYPSYSEADRKFRYIRDIILTKEEYEKLMDALVEHSGIPIAALKETFWMKREHITRLHRKGHMVGLHSHTHPTFLEALSPEAQRKEYTDNASVLSGVVNERIVCMSHPSNSYNSNTLDILKELGIKIGFRATPDKKEHSKLEYPRFDSTFLVREVRI